MIFDKIQQKYVPQKHQYLYYMIFVYFRVNPFMTETVII